MPVGTDPEGLGYPQPDCAEGLSLDYGCVVDTCRTNDTYPSRIHSAHEISRIEQVATAHIPTTPVRRSAVFRGNQRTGTDASPRSPDIGLCVTPTALLAPPFGTLCPRYRTPECSTSANIGRRRVQNASLLNSPARPGHASRMKQIFEEAGAKPTGSRGDGVVLYPQLPNVSRTASPSPWYQKGQSAHRDAIANSIGAPFSPVQPLATVPERERTGKYSMYLSETSSESWSDDSGYLGVASGGQGSGAAVCLDKMIYDWLSGVSEAGEEPERQYCVTVSDKKRPSHQRGLEPKHPHRGHIAVIDDPFMGTVSGRSRSGSSTSGSQYATARSLCLPTSARSQRHISDVCRQLDFEQSSSAGEANVRTAGLFPLTTNASDQTSLVSTLQEYDKDDLELSPLSPNVCIERGPARHLSAHDSSRRNSTKLPETTPTKHGKGKMKELIRVEEGVPPSAKTGYPLASTQRSNRFWHQSHVASGPIGS